MFMNHPNVLKLYGFFHDAKNIYLILEYCNKCLFRELRQKVNFYFISGKIQWRRGRLLFKTMYCLAKIHAQWKYHSSWYQAIKYPHSKLSHQNVWFWLVNLCPCLVNFKIISVNARLFVEQLIMCLHKSLKVTVMMKGLIFGPWEYYFINWRVEQRLLKQKIKTLLMKKLLKVNVLFPSFSVFN